ncbi:MAG: hypothetical protein IBX57_02570 [Gammaproteobacteria bacterium]|nr:hypothetical protein [Gammaproteobacteria bacterium]
MHYKNISLITIVLLLFSNAINAEEANYHECLFNKNNEENALNTKQTIALYCASRHFDTAPTAFQAQVLKQDLEGMKKRDPKFKSFYDTMRQNGSYDIYTDQQIILMYIDKREVNKD